MKKFSVFFTFFFLSSLVYSQVDIGFKANFGIGSIRKIGPALNADIKPKFSPSFNIGTFIENPVCSNFNLGAELNYSNFTHNESISFETMALNADMAYDVKSEVKQKLTTISIPIYAKYKVEKMSFIAGPQISYVLAYRLYQATTLTDSSGNAQYYDLNEKVKHSSFDFGYTLGLNYSIIKHLEAEARFYQSVRSSFEKADPTVGSIRPTSFTLGIRYSIN